MDEWNRDIVMDYTSESKTLDVRELILNTFLVNCIKQAIDDYLDIECPLRRTVPAPSRDTQGNCVRYPF